MEVTWLSPSADKGFVALRWPSVTVLVDGHLHCRPMLDCAPAALVQGTSAATLPGVKADDAATDGGGGDLPLVSLNGRNFVDCAPEVAALQLYGVDVEEVDAVFVSNSHSLLALPYLTEKPGFRAAVYATDPTVQFGRLAMEDLLEYFEMIQKDALDANLKAKKDLWRFARTLCNRPPFALTRNVGLSTEPYLWARMYDRDSLTNCLSKIKFVAFKEKIDVYGLLEASAYSAGYLIGSCNWMFKVDGCKVCVVGASSNLSAHPASVDTASLRGADALLLSGLCRSPLSAPQESIGAFCRAVEGALREGGCALVPCSPTGVLFDLLEVLGAHLDASVAVPADVPIYFVAPSADSSLAFANIYAEWLSEGKLSKVYVPEEPFPHGQMMRAGRLKAYSAIYKEFSREYRSPCVVFTGHQYLRCGDAVHLMQMWRNDPKSAVIFTDQDLDYDQILAPYEPLRMKVHVLPIDTRLTFEQAEKLVKELSPTVVLAPEALLRPPPDHADRLDLQINLKDVVALPTGEPVSVSLRSDSKRIRIDPEIIRAMKPGAEISSIRGSLSAFDNRFELKAVPETNRQANLKTFGKLDGQTLLAELVKNKIAAECDNLQSDSFTITLPDAKGSIRVENRSATQISCDDSVMRRVVRDVVLSLLTQI